MEDAHVIQRKHAPVVPSPSGFVEARTPSAYAQFNSAQPMNPLLLIDIIYPRKDWLFKGSNAKESGTTGWSWLYANVERDHLL